MKTYIEYLTESELNDNFWKWFDDSKVVDASGQPLVVYHGSYDFGFSEFNKKYRGTSTNAKSAKLGFYFTDNISEAKMYANRSASGGLYSVFLKMNDPLIYRYENNQNINWDYDFTKLLKTAIQSGNDGLILLNTFDNFKPHNQYIVFSPTQIKSVDNRGTWNPDDPNIYK